MKKFLLILCMILFASCNLRITTVSKEEKQQEEIIEKQNNLNKFVTMQINDVWKYSYYITVYRVYGGWIVSEFGRSDNGKMFIPYDDFIKEYNDK